MASQRNRGQQPDEWQPLNTVDPEADLWDDDSATFVSSGRRDLDRASRGHCGNCSQCQCRCSCASIGASRMCGVIAAVLVMVAMSALGAGLGYYSLVVHQPPLVIDKSVNAFSIPKHKAYVHWDSLQLAKKNNMSRLHYRRRRESVPGSAESLQPSKPSLGLEKSQRTLSKLANSSNVLFPDISPPGSSVKSGDFNLHNFGVDSDFADQVEMKQSLSEKDFHQGHAVNKRNVEIVSPSCKNQCQRYPRWHMHVIFEAIGDDPSKKDPPNIFTTERLKTIHEIELAIMAHARFTQFCLKNPQLLYDPAVAARNGCVPLNSLMTYFYPSTNEHGDVFYDGLGNNLGNIDSALKYAMSRSSFYYYVDDKINASYRQSKFLRTEVQFGAPLEGFAVLSDRREEQESEFKNFVYTYPGLLSNASTSKVRVLYGSNELFDHEVSDTFWADLHLALWAVGFIVLFMFILTSFSLWLTLCGVLSIAISFPMALFFYRVAAGVNALGILNGAAAFVIIGIGVDDVFVFVNIFRQSTKHDSLRSRLMYTIRTAGRATFFTSFTTAAAFAANIASSIPAVYEFGLFMALIVSCCWLTVVIIMPPALYIWSLAFLRCEAACLPCCRSGSSAELARAGEFEASHTSLDEDDDVPLLELEENLAAIENADDIGMLVPDPYQVTMASRTPAARSRSGCVDIGGFLQRGLVAFTSAVVIRGRWFIIGFYVLLVGAGIGLMSQLTPDDKPPQLFHPDTNLQRLLDLKANFSIIDSLRCDRCSAIYNQDPHPLQTTPPVQSPSFRAPLRSTTTTTAATTRTSTAASTPSPSASRTATPSSAATARPPSSQTMSPHSTRPGVDKTSSPQQGPQQPTSPGATTSGEAPGSVQKNFDACSNRQCRSPTSRPPIKSGSTVFVVFGIQGLQRNNSNQGHVINEEEGRVIFDEKFREGFQDLTKVGKLVRDLCKICQVIANASDLVRDRHADCISPGLRSFLPDYLRKILESEPHCQNLPSMPHTVMDRSRPQALGSFVNSTPLWLSFVFESKTKEGEGYFSDYADYQKWEDMMMHIRSKVLDSDSPLQSIFQTSEFWKKVLMEVVAVNSAIYSVVLSLLICIVAVSIFTGHPALLFIVFITIFGVVCSVLGLFYLLGWRMGAVEAISLSILVGSSVDYCVHLVEGFLLAQPAPHLSLLQPQTNAQLRQERTRKAVQHIGVSIVSSAITTITAAVPLTQTTIQPFAKFGRIVLINTSLSILFTLTLSAALLVLMGPARFRLTLKSSGIATAVVTAVVGVLVLVLFAISRTVYPIPGPGGGPLFP